MKNNEKHGTTYTTPDELFSLKKKKTEKQEIEEGFPFTLDEIYSIIEKCNHKSLKDYIIKNYKDSGMLFFEIGYFNDNIQNYLKHYQETLVLNPNIAIVKIRDINTEWKKYHHLRKAATCWKCKHCYTYADSTCEVSCCDLMPDRKGIASHTLSDDVCDLFVQKNIK